MLYVSFVVGSHGFGWRCDVAKIEKIEDFNILSEKNFKILSYGFFCIFAAQRSTDEIKCNEKSKAEKAILDCSNWHRIGVGSLALMAMVFASAGIPVECVAVAAGIDRIIDMGRTVMSVTGDASCAVVMQKHISLSETVN